MISLGLEEVGLGELGVRREDRGLQHVHRTGSGQSTEGQGSALLCDWRNQKSRVKWHMTPGVVSLLLMTNGLWLNGLSGCPQLLRSFE